MIRYRMGVGLGAVRLGALFGCAAPPMRPTVPEVRGRHCRCDTVVMFSTYSFSGSGPGPITPPLRPRNDPRLGKPPLFHPLRGDYCDGMTRATTPTSHVSKSQRSIVEAQNPLR